jgi:hypothetical protein
MLLSIVVLWLEKNHWSFRGGTRGNAVPILKKLSERIGTEFPWLLYGRMRGNSNSSQFKYTIIMYRGHSPRTSSGRGYPLPHPPLVRPPKWAFPLLFIYEMTTEKNSMRDAVFIGMVLLKDQQWRLHPHAVSLFPQQ